MVPKKQEAALWLPPPSGSVPEEMISHPFARDAL